MDFHWVLKTQDTQMSAVRLSLWLHYKTEYGLSIQSEIL